MTAKKLEQRKKEQIEEVIKAYNLDAVGSSPVGPVRLRDALMEAYSRGIGDGFRMGEEAGQYRPNDAH